MREFFLFGKHHGKDVLKIICKNKILIGYIIKESVK